MKQIKSLNLSFLRFLKMAMLVSLFLFSVGYVTTNTVAFLTEYEEANGNVSIGKWEGEEEGEGN
ncbi:hypothetical protein KFZ58_14840 [Virgibacillus sp. NKC19-16]|uniref:hypothetical protein n=1 Tax=Virgibacillus salidurans TaxID=2831673 RepID=UPI001F1B594D|nr:hypothetical protein [Virgibacillus sp. NKC19-16]UJL45655.1 hypothetical protein KFZ58_14840 [Virgibacillus sp. NKC19-16]